MPQDMQAVINFRLADGDTAESVMAHCREAVQDPTVEMRYLQANDPSATVRRDGYGYRTVMESMERYYPGVVFLPSMTVGPRTPTTMSRSVTPACGAVPSWQSRRKRPPASTGPTSASRCEPICRAFGSSST